MNIEKLKAEINELDDDMFYREGVSVETIVMDLSSGTIRTVIGDGIASDVFDGRAVTLYCVGREQRGGIIKRALDDCIPLILEILNEEDTETRANLNGDLDFTVEDRINLLGGASYGDVQDAFCADGDDEILSRIAKHAKIETAAAEYVRDCGNNDCPLYLGDVIDAMTNLVADAASVAQ